MDCKTPSKLKAHLDRKIPCDQGKYECADCKHKFTTWAARHRHVQNKVCKGVILTREQLDEENADLQQRVSEFEEAIEEHLQQIDATQKDNTLLLQENRLLMERNKELQREIELLRVDMQFVRTQFVFDVGDIFHKGIYLVITAGITLDVPAPASSLVVKFGRATERTIAERAKETLSRHPDNSILYARKTQYGKKAEDKLKDLLSTFRFRKSGCFPDGSHSIEFAVFQPSQANQIKQMFDLAVFQAEAESAKSSADIEIEKLKLQLEILKLQNGGAV